MLQRILCGKLLRLYPLLSFSLSLGIPVHRILTDQFLGVSLCSLDSLMLYLLCMFLLYLRYVKFFSVYLICSRIQVAKSHIPYDYRTLIRAIVLNLN